MNITEFRKKYPQYDDMSDQDLSDRFYEKYYSDMPRDIFDQKFGAVTKERVFEPGPDFISTAEKSTPNLMAQMRNLGRGITEQLPIAGGVFGAAVGAGGVSVPGAALGAMGGQALKQLIQGVGGEGYPTWGESAKQMAFEGAGAAMGEAPAGLARLGVRKALGPYASKMTGEQMDLARMIEAKKPGIWGVGEKSGLPLSPDLYSPSRLAKPIQWIADWFPTGRIWATHKRGQFLEGLLRMREDVVKGLPKAGDKYEAGIKLNDAIKGYTKGAALQTKAAYGAWLKELGGKDVRVPMQNLLEFTKKSGEIKNMSSSHPLKSLIDEFRLKGSTWNGDEIDEFQKQIWGAGPKNMRLKGQIWEALKKDLTIWDNTKGVQTLKKLEAGQEAFKLEKVFKSNRTVRAIAVKYKTDPENIIKAAFRSGNIDDVKQIQVAISKEDWDLARSRFIQNLLDASTDNRGLTPIFNPGKFSRDFEKYKRQIQETMPDVYAQIRDFATMSKAAVSDVQRKNIGWGGVMGMLAGSSLMGGGGIASAGLGAGIAVPAGFSLFVSKSLMNPRGWTRAWLTTGMLGRKGFQAMPQLAGEAARVGTMKYTPELLRQLGTKEEQVPTQ